MPTPRQESPAMPGKDAIIVKLEPADATLVRWGIGLFFVFVLAGIILADSQINALTGYHADAFLKVAVRQGVYNISLAGTTRQISMVCQAGEFYSVDRDLHVRIYGHALRLPTIWRINVAAYWPWLLQEGAKLQDRYQNMLRHYRDFSARQWFYCGGKAGSAIILCNT